MHVKPEVIILLEESIGEKLPDFDLVNVSLAASPEAHMQQNKKYTSGITSN